MSNIKTIFGRQIRILRQEKNMTQERLAELSDISVSFLGGIERGQKSPTIETVEKLASALGISMGQLLARCDGELSSGKKDLVYNLISEYTERIMYAFREEY